jgi:hypothetical protein
MILILKDHMRDWLIEIILYPDRPEPYGVPKCFRHFRGNEILLFLGNRYEMPEEGNWLHVFHDDSIFWVRQNDFDIVT